MYLTFNGDCLKQDKFYYTFRNIINVYIVYDLTSTTNYNSDFTLENCLFGSVKIIKNTDVNKYTYFGYGIGFDGKGVFTHPTGSFGNNAIIFRVGMSIIMLIIKKIDILILGKDPTQGLEEHSLTAEKIYLINFSATKRRFCLSLHYNRTNSYLFVNGVEIIKFKAKIKTDPLVGVIIDVLCLGNVLKDFFNK